MQHKVLEALIPANARGGRNHKGTGFTTILRKTGNGEIVTGTFDTTKTEQNINNDAKLLIISTKQNHLIKKDII